MTPSRCLRLFVIIMIRKSTINCLAYVSNWKVAYCIIPRLIQMISLLICITLTTVLRRLAFILRKHKNSWQCISWIICARNIKSWSWWFKIKWDTLMVWSNYKPQSRIIGWLIIVIKILIVAVMMNKVNVRR